MPLPRRSKTGKHAVGALTHDKKALQLRLQGFSYEQISAKLGLGRTTAYKCVMRALERLRAEVNELAADVRDMELQRLDEMFHGCYPEAKQGDKDAIASALKIMERRAKLLGIDVPTKSEISGPDGGAIEIEDARNQLAEALAKLAPGPEPRSDSADDSDTPG